jgi:FAD:protein FMN transferase
VRSSRPFCWLLIVIGACAAVDPAPTVPAGVPPDAPLPQYTFAEVHMGMPVRLTFHAPDEAAARAAARAAFRTVAALDDTFSDYRAHSELRRVEARAGHWVPVSAPLFDLLARALEIATLTDGAFDPAAGHLTALWRDARRDGAAPDPHALGRARERAGPGRVRLDSVAHAAFVQLDTRLDLGAIAKGYTLDAALATLRTHGVHAALVEAGGDVVAGAPPPGRDGWTVHVTGADTAFAARAATLAHAALASSGPAAQFVELNGVRHSHVFDPRTGRALTTAYAVHVIARDGALADALATALAVGGPGDAARSAARFGASVHAWTFAPSP